MTDDGAKVVFIGSQGVGKTSIINRATAREFSDQNVPTVSGSWQQYDVQIGDKECCLRIWDTAGQEKYRGITPI
jgi:small GTP-binding protein